jgi:hypothetical protein
MPKREYVKLDIDRLRKTLLKKNVTMSAFARISSIDYNHLSDHMTGKVKTTREYRDNVLKALDNIDNTDRWERYRAWQEGESDGLENIPITAEDVYNNFT